MKLRSAFCARLPRPRPRPAHDLRGHDDFALALAAGRRFFGAGCVLPMNLSQRWVRVLAYALRLLAYVVLSSPLAFTAAFVGWILSHSLIPPRGPVFGLITDSVLLTLGFQLLILIPFDPLRPKRSKCPLPSPGGP